MSVEDSYLTSVSGNLLRSVNHFSEEPFYVGKADQDLSWSEKGHPWLAKPLYFLVGVVAVVESLARGVFALLSTPALISKSGREWYVKFNGMGLFITGASVYAAFHNLFKCPSSRSGYANIAWFFLNLKFSFAIAELK